MSVKTHTSGRWWWLAALPPVLFWLYYFHRFVVQNIPQMDDFTYTIDFWEPFVKAGSLKEKWKVLAIQHHATEHRVPLPKALIYVQYLLTGRMDFDLMAWCGNLIAIPGTFLVAWRAFRRTQAEGWLLLPVVLLFFQVQYFEIFTWSNCSLLYVFPVFLAWTSLYLAVFQENSPGRFLLSVAFAVLCFLNFGNGMFLFLPLVGVLAYQRRWEEAFGTGVLGALLVWWYFQGYRPNYGTALSFMGLRGVAIMLGAWLAPLEGQGRYDFSTLLGLALIATALFAWFGVLRAAFGPARLTPLNRVRLFWVAALAFMLMTGAAVAIKRTDIKGLPELYTSRYRFVSIWAVGACYLLVVTYLTRFHRAVLGWTAGLLAAGVSVWSYYYYHAAIINHQERYLVHSFNYDRHGQWLLFPPENDWTKISDNGTRRILTQGLYRFPARFFTGKDALPAAAASSVVKLKISKLSKGILLSNEDFVLPQRSTPSKGACLLLTRADTAYFWPLERLQNNGQKDFLKTGHYFGKGFQTLLRPHVLPSGTYQMALLVREGEKQQLYPTDQTVTL